MALLPNSFVIVAMQALTASLLVGGATANHNAALVKDVVIDFNAVVSNASTFVHGVDNGPLCSTGSNFSTQLHAIGGTLIRTHDMNVLDWDVIYPDPAADPELPASYNLTPGDEAFKNIVDSGFSPYLRLGNSWNNPVWSRLPTNVTAFARISVRTLQHYNDGWASGFTGKAIKYVEIWNEPDGSRFWNGTCGYYYELYDATAAALKAYDAGLMVGGPAVSELFNTNYSSAFLQHVATVGSPIDFFSWHHYGWPAAQNASQYIPLAATARQMIANAGLPTTVQSFLTEWNIGVLTDVADTPLAASFVASVLTYMQQSGSKVDLSIFYPGCTTDNPPAPTNATDGWGLWGDSPTAGVVWRPMAHAYMAVGQTLRSTPLLLNVSTAESDVEENYSILAGRQDGSEDSINVVVSAESSRFGAFQLLVVDVPASSSWNVTVLMIDATRNLEPCYAGTVSATSSGSLQLPHFAFLPPAVAWVQLTPML